MRTYCHPFGRPALFALLVLACACADHPVASVPTPAPSHLTAEYTCTVEVKPGTVTCREVQAGGGASANVILGSPYVTFVTTTASSRSNPADEDTTSYTVAIRNAAPQPLGTTDGINLASGGIRLFFSTAPEVKSVSSGTVASASIRLETPDGTATFTNQNGSTTFTDRMYFQYGEVLAPGDTTDARSMQFIYNSNVLTFSFGYRVSAPAQYEHGWVTISPGSVGVLSPGGTVTLTGTVYNQVGQVQADGITWLSSNPAVATVSTSGEVTAVAVGMATITATSTVNAQRSGTRAIVVDAAPSLISTTPANGAVGILAGGDIVINFSEPVNVAGAGFALECPAGSARTVTLSGSGTSTITLNPDADLPAATTCTVTVIAGQVSDVDASDGPDVMAANYVFSFESGIKANNDLFGEIIYGMINTATTLPPFSVTANDQLNSSTTISFAGWNGAPGKTQQGGNVVMDASGAGMGHFTYDPPAGYAGIDSLEYTVQSGSATSTAKVALLVNADAAPAVDSTTPADGAFNASPGGAIVVHFSEAVSVSAGSFTLGCTSGPQPFTISGSGTSTVTLTPVSSLPTGDTCTVVVLASNVSDADANDGPDHLAENYSFWFVVEGFGGLM